MQGRAVHTAGKARPRCYVTEAAARPGRATKACPSAPEAGGEETSEDSRATREGDQVIREDPAVRSSYVRGRGTETSAEVLVGPPWRMESNAVKREVSK